MASSLPPVPPAAFHRIRPDNACHLIVGSRVLTVAHHPTKTWLAYLGDQALHRIFPGLLRRQDQAWIHEKLADRTSRFDIPHVRDMSRDVITAVTGLPWYTAVRLANVAGTAWFIADPTALLRGVDLLALPVRRTLSVVYALQREGAKDDADRAAIDRDLWALPDGERPAWTPEQQQSSFAAFRAALPARARQGTG